MGSFTNRTTGPAFKCAATRAMPVPPTSFPTITPPCRNQSRLPPPLPSGEGGRGEQKRDARGNEPRPADGLQAGHPRERSGQQKPISRSSAVRRPRDAAAHWHLRLQQLKRSSAQLTRHFSDLLCGPEAPNGSFRPQRESAER